MKKKNEKLNYIHFNPVKRGLVTRPADWKWSSYLFYWQGEKRLCSPNPEWQGNLNSEAEKEKSKHARIAKTAKRAAPAKSDERRGH